jgi:hypothetical protein
MSMPVKPRVVDSGIKEVVRTGPPQVSSAHVTSLLADVEALACGETGEIRVSRGPTWFGSIYVEAGTVCWASIAGAGTRLTRRLVDAAAISREEMERHYQRAIQEGAPLGEYLVGRKIVAQGDLRNALREHTNDALDAFADRGAIFHFARRSRSYHPKFRFSANELLLAAARRTVPAVSGWSERTLVAVCGAHAEGVAFSATGGRRGLVAACGFVGASASEISALGEFAHGYLKLTERLREGPDRATVLMDGAQQGTFIWREGGCTFLVAAKGKNGTAHVMRNLRINWSSPSQETLAVAGPDFQVPERKESGIVERGPRESNIEDERTNLATRF